MKDRIAKRYFFLVDQDGIVRGRWLGEDLDVFSSAELLRATEELARPR